MIKHQFFKNKMDSIFHNITLKHMNISYDKQNILTYLQKINYVIYNNAYHLLFNIYNDTLILLTYIIKHECCYQ